MTGKGLRDRDSSTNNQGPVDKISQDGLDSKDQRQVKGFLLWHMEGLRCQLGLLRISRLVSRLVRNTTHLANGNKTTWVHNGLGPLSICRDKLQTKYLRACPISSPVISFRRRVDKTRLKSRYRPLWINQNSRSLMLLSAGVGRSSRMND